MDEVVYYVLVIDTIIMSPTQKIVSKCCFNLKLFFVKIWLLSESHVIWWSRSRHRRLSVQLSSSWSRLDQMRRHLDREGWFQPPCDGRWSQHLRNGELLLLGIPELPWHGSSRRSASKQGDINWLDQLCAQRRTHPWKNVVVSWYHQALSP